MGALVLVFLLFKGFEIIVSKYNGYEKFNKFAVTKWRIIYDLSKCKFCMDHHLSIVSMAIVYLLIGSFESYFLILPICSASINNILNDRSKN